MRVRPCRREKLAEAGLDSHQPAGLVEITVYGETVAICDPEHERVLWALEGLNGSSKSAMTTVLGGYVKLVAACEKAGVMS